MKIKCKICGEIHFSRESLRDHLNQDHTKKISDFK